MIVAVTGAGGFLGGIIVHSLRAAGHEVRALSASVPGAVPLPGFDAPHSAHLAAIGSASHVVHCAGLTNASPNTPEHVLMDANARLTGRVAGAAAEIGARFIFLSSIRAVVEPSFSGVINDKILPTPGSAYGRSKRAAEVELLAAYERAGRPEHAVSLRLAPVYGERMGGNLARLMRLADTPLPLPVVGLPGCRSLVGADAVAGAMLHLLGQARFGQPAYVVSDGDCLSLAEILAAFRSGLGRARRLISAQPALLARLAGLAGKSEGFRALTARQVCDAGALTRTGWRQEQDTAARLRELAASGQRVKR